MRKFFRWLWNTWRMPRDKEYVDIVQNGKVIANVRCYRVTNMHKWSFATCMVNHGHGWHKILRNGSVGQPQNGLSWKFPNGI